MQTSPGCISHPLTIVVAVSSIAVAFTRRLATVIIARSSLLAGFGL